MKISEDEERLEEMYVITHLGAQNKNGGRNKWWNGLHMRVNVGG